MTIWHLHSQVIWYKTKTRSVKSKRGASTGIIKHCRGHFELSKIGFFEGGADQGVQEGGNSDWLDWHFSIWNNGHLIFFVVFLYLQGRVYCRGAVHRDQGGGEGQCGNVELLRSWGYVSITLLHNPQLSWVIECELFVAFSRFCSFSVLIAWNTVGHSICILFKGHYTPGSWIMGEPIDFERGLASVFNWIGMYYLGRSQIIKTEI